MKLDQLVETTFLPPPVMRGYESISSEEFHFNCKNHMEGFLPSFVGQGTSYFIKDNVSARCENSAKVFFDSKKDAIKHCWGYFREKKTTGSFVPKVTKK